MDEDGETGDGGKKLTLSTFKKTNDARGLVSDEGKQLPQAEHRSGMMAVPSRLTVYPRVGRSF